MEAMGGVAVIVSAAVLLPSLLCCISWAVHAWHACRDRTRVWYL
jgi:hypothetical protein